MSDKTKVQSCKLYDDKYKIASTHVRNTDVFALIAVLVLSYWAVKFLLKCRLLFKKITNFTVKFLQNYR